MRMCVGGTGAERGGDQVRKEEGGENRPGKRSERPLVRTPPCTHLYLSLLGNLDSSRAASQRSYDCLHDFLMCVCVVCVHQRPENVSTPLMIMMLRQRAPLYQAKRKGSCDARVVSVRPRGLRPNNHHLCSCQARCVCALQDLIATSAAAPGGGGGGGNLKVGAFCSENLMQNARSKARSKVVY